MKKWTSTEVLWTTSLELEAHAVKKNSRTIIRVGHRLIPGKSPKLKRAETILTNRLMRLKPKNPITGPIGAHMTFWFPDSVFTAKSTGEMSKKMPDLSNLLELPQDCMQKAGIILNDSQIVIQSSQKAPHEGGFKLEIELCRAELLSGRDIELRIINGAGQKVIAE